MTTPTRIAATFADLRARQELAFMPFVTAGDPDMATTLALIRELASRGVDMIEVGFPYSDPIADGPVIQASYTRALENHLHVSDIFAAIGSIQEEKLPPLVAMVSYAIVFRTGIEAFIEKLQQAGFSGMIVPDLPGDEAEELAKLLASAKIDLVQLIAPTTTQERTARILQTASGFLYCISVAGTTGVRESLPAELLEQLAWLKTQTDLPLAVGFGISRPEHVDPLKGIADGVIVGSAIVKQAAQIAAGTATADTVLKEIGEFAAEMLAATRS